MHEWRLFLPTGLPLLARGNFRWKAASWLKVGKREIIRILGIPKVVLCQELNTT